MSSRVVLNGAAKPATQQIAIMATPSNTLTGVYAKRFEFARENVVCELRAATPEWAREVLESQNLRNRPMSQSWVKIRAAIAQQRWHVNGECIVFDIENVLIDGQHRLEAIADSGITVPVLVFYGIDPEAFKTFDMGQKRDAADTLSINGTTSSHTVAAALGWQQAYDQGKIHDYRERHVPADMAIDLLNMHPGIADSVSATGKHKTKLISPSLLAFLHYQFNGRDPELCEEWVRQVVSGIGVTDGSPAHLLRRRLEGLMGPRHVTVYITIAALCIKTWNRMRAGERGPRTVLVWRDDEPFPTIN